MSILNAREPSSPPPRVLMLLSNCFDPDPRVHNEARSLVEHGYEAQIVAWDRERLRPEKEIVDGIEIRRVYVKSSHGRGWSQMLFMPLVFLRMTRAALRTRFDVVHAHDFDTLPAGLFLAWLRDRPLVYDSHEDYAGMLHGSIPVWLEHLIRRVETRLIRRIDLLITVGENLRSQFRRRGCTNVRVVGNWKSPVKFRLPSEVRDQVRTELQIPADKLMVLYISNLGPERHIEELLEAIAQRPDIYLVIGGKGPQSALVKEYSEKCPNILYLGFVEQKEIPRYTSACDLVYYGFDLNNPNSHYSAPNKLFEALAAGRPMLTAKFGEIGEIVSLNHCGVILNDYSVLEILRGLDACIDPAFLVQLKTAAAGAGRTEYTWERAEQVLLGAYGELLPAPPVTHSDLVREAVAR